MSGFYHGFTAHIISRLGQITIRNLIYKTLYDTFKPPKAHNDLTTREKSVIAGLAGGIAALILNPFEVVATRMIADGGILKEYRRNYTSAMDGYGKVSAEGGVMRGAGANIIKMILMNVSLTAPYDYIREKMWITWGDHSFCHPLAIAYASAVCTAVTLPIDNIKTRL
jgi:solute carrier family 25 oxoglutarate transporter 11